MIESNAEGIPTQAPKRRKARGPRSRTGCQTCRIRRVKCDEQRPACHKCSSTGRTCDYEIQSPPVLTPSHDPDPPFQAMNIVNPQPLPLSLVPIPSHDYESRRSFSFFHAHTAPQLSGAFESHFWDRLILQSTHRSSTLWHAAVALGAIHERFSAGDQSVFRGNDDWEQGGFALREYGRAIGSLTAQKGGVRQSADVVLAACIMFACFEIMRGHHGTALTHIQSAIKIIAELQNGENGAQSNSLVIPNIPLIPMETLTTLFTRLDSQLCELQPARSEYILTPASTYEPGFSSIIPHKFTSITEARNCFDYLYNDAIHDEHIVNATSADFNKFDKDVRERSDRATAESLNKFARWKLALNAFLKSQGSRLDKKDQQAINMLNLRQTVATQAFGAMGEAGECVWDNFTQEYESIINLADCILSASPGTAGKSSTPPSSSSPQRTFSLDPGVVVPLFNTIWKCRISSLRRRAIRLLKKYPRQEGVWDSALVAIACDRIVEIEEEGLGECEDPGMVEEWRRVLDVGVVFDMQERKGVLSYEKMKGRESGERVRITDGLSW